MQSKEQFFKEQLIPVAQLVELLLAQLRADTKTKKRTGALLFPPLHDVAVYALNPQRKPDFAKLAKALDLYASTLVGWLQVYHRSQFSGRERLRELEHTVTHRQATLRAAITVIHEAIQFSQRGAERWRKSEMRLPTALTKTGKPSQWRTLVANTPLDATLARFKLTKHELKIPTLGSRVGRAALPELWVRLFDTELTQGEPPAKAKRVAKKSAKASPVPLPAAIQVEKLDSGLLKIRAEFAPMEHLVQARLPEGTLLPAALAHELIPQVHCVDCSYTEASVQLQAAVDWLKDLTDVRMPEIQARYNSWTQLKARQALRSKLQTALSEEEYRLLQTMLPAE